MDQQPSLREARRRRRLEHAYPDADWGVGEFLDARKARLTDILEDVGMKNLTYLYDFGDGWEHTIKTERLLDPKPACSIRV